MTTNIIKNVIRLPFALCASLVGVPASIFFWAVIDDEGSKWPLDAEDLRLIFWPPNVEISHDRERRTDESKP